MEKKNLDHFFKTKKGVKFTLSCVCIVCVGGCVIYREVVMDKVDLTPFLIYINNSNGFFHNIFFKIVPKLSTNSIKWVLINGRFHVTGVTPFCKF